MCYGGTPQIAHTTSSVHKVNEHSSTNNTNSKPSTTPVSPSVSLFTLREKKKNVNILISYLKNL